MFIHTGAITRVYTTTTSLQLIHNQDIYIKYINKLLECGGNDKIVVMCL